MRPGHFYPGKRAGAITPNKFLRSFNEAGAFLPRKTCGPEAAGEHPLAGFNEAGAFLPRKTPRGGDVYLRVVAASMRPGHFYPGKTAAALAYHAGASALQ